jgi:hypothetical protein
LKYFTPKNQKLKEMNNDHRGKVAFDYRWLFFNEIQSSVRVFENECRSNFNKKTIGSFYNEDLLFKKIKKSFGENNLVISQGSPEWLSPQRFDIYFPKLKVAIEYQGEQHLGPVDFGGRGKKFAKKQFQKNQERDQRKKDKADKNNCTIIYVYPNYDLSKVKKRVKDAILDKNE